MKLSFLIFLGLLSAVLPFKLEDPEVDGVEFISDGSSTTTINVDEDNDGPNFRFVLISDVQGELTFEISADSQTKTRLDVQKEPVSDNSLYLTANRLDYEAMGGIKSIAIDVMVENNPTTRQMIVMSIINLDDESPTFSATPCAMEENAVYTAKNSPCECTISDPDGFLDTMVFTIEAGTKNEDQVFELAYKETPAHEGVYESPVYLVLKEGITLDYETITYYNFHVAAHDNANHPTIPIEEVPVIVQVIDLPDTPPVWDSTFKSVINIVEKTVTKIQVSAAVVGFDDLEIGYTITSSSLPDRVIVDKTGLVTIKEIDRDTELTGTNNQASYSIRAYQVVDETLYLEGNVTLLVEDIDDNVAEITSVDIQTVDGKKLIDITVDERVLDLGLAKLTANDIDFGEHATYTVVIESGSADYDYTQPFRVIPPSAYAETDISVAVMNPDQLDFETEGWAVINFRLLTIGIYNESMIDEVDVRINLNDINDELPIFDPEEYSATLPENVTMDYVVTFIQATDKDAEDANLPHHLQGTLANSILKIKEYGGDISTIVENAFDYEKQTEVIIQIMAIDAAEHKASAQLTIIVTDVNDENPVLHVTTVDSIEENQKDGAEIPSTITATDIDTKPYLNFSINWEKSYATKNSLRLNQTVFDQYLGWVIVETIRDEETDNSVTAKLIVSELVKDNTPDFEVFDSMYINLVVTDLRTEVDGAWDNDAMIVISIIDINDNPPVFADDTETTKRTVIENSVDDTVITAVFATDADVGTQLNYSIKAHDDSPLWVDIDGTGTIFVHLPEDTDLDCDDPPRDYLKYEVTAHDGDPTHDASAIITISIIDQNENAPTMDDPEPYHLLELENGDMSHNGDTILELDPRDIDRDVPYHTVACTFGPSTTSAITSRFKFFEDKIIQLDLAEGVNLDREEMDTYSFELNCKDDPTSQGSVSNPINPPPKITIILDDINDNPPTIIDTESTVVTENAKKGVIATLQGQDKDIGDNGLIGVAEIQEITRYPISKDDEDSKETLSNDVLGLNVIEDNKIELDLNKDNLDGLYGYLVLNIALTDKGTPSLSSTVDVTITVTKYNFQAPKFVGDYYDSPIYLQDIQTPNSALMTWDGLTPLPNIKATDQQNGKFLIRFDLEDGLDIFKIANAGNSEGILQVVTDTFERKQYNLKVIASLPDSTEGNAATSTTKTISVNFFDKSTTDPTFKTLDETTQCEENVEDWYQDIDPASYSDVAPDGLKIYYLLAEGDKSWFSVNQTTGRLSILQPFDYEEQTTYTVIIQASNSPSLKQDAVKETRLTITINVIDVNDNDPIFDSHDYSGILVTTDTNHGDNAIVTVEATDVDTTSQGHLTYAITSYTASDPSIQSVKEPFLMGNKTGRITLNPTFKPTRSLKGFFTLKVIVCDEDCLNDNATVIIYLVTETNLVEFSFGNDLTTVQNATEQIKSVLDDKFPDYNTNVQSPTAGESDEINIVRTNSPTYFLNKKSHEPVDAQDIKREVVNVDFFNKLKSAFANVGLTLLSFNPDNTTTENIEATLKAWLIGVSVVLGALCLILLIAFVLKTRSLNQRIDKLSNTKFGSQESGLNRTGVAAPTTNKHAVEGSNPVYNNEVDTKDIDRRSVTSGDSDLIGVEDDDKFNYGDGDEYDAAS